MSFTTRGRARRLSAIAALLAGVAAAASPTTAGAVVTPGTTAQDGAPRTYIVQFKAPPLASYRGGVDRIPATSPLSTGAKRLAPRSSAATRYRSHLAAVQRSVLGRLGTRHPRAAYSYRAAFSGFAARLSPAQARTLRRAPDVAHVWVSRRYRVQDAPDLTDPVAVDDFLGGFQGASASYLGLPQGLWNALGGPDDAGSGVIVGLLDTGIAPQHPSFADDPADGYLGSPYPSSPPARWRGACETGADAPTPSWTLADCNGKLIGASYYYDGFGVDNLAPDAFLSARDDDGHGSHTASIAAGNFGVSASIADTPVDGVPITGIAPRAYIAEYKVCWPGKTADLSGCTTADSLAAVDAAVQDGVDVINYSIGGPASVVADPLEIAFLGATDAGVFVAAAAGNDGPEAGTVGAPAAAPWVTSVAADTLARSFTSSPGPGGIVPSFSARGPQTVVPDIPVPDVTAPGVNILGANTPVGSTVSSGITGESFQLLSGTSMATPQVAGAAALLIERHPSWSPAAVRSALMTTADPDVHTDAGGTPADLFDAGSGEIDPTRADDPGLVLEATTGDYLDYLDGVDPAYASWAAFQIQDAGDTPTPIAATDLNLPAIASSSLVGSLTTRRTFTSVDSHATTWQVAVDGLPGLTAHASPAHPDSPGGDAFTVAPGDAETVTLHVGQDGAPVGTYAFGALVLTETGPGAADPPRTVRVPIAVRPVAVSRPATIGVSTDQASGSQAVAGVVAGFTGTLDMRAWGLAPAVAHLDQTIDLSISDTPVLDGTDADGTKVIPVAVPAGTRLLAAQITRVSDTSSATDLDLYVYSNPNGTACDGTPGNDDLGDAAYVDVDGTASSLESVDEIDPAPGCYLIVVHGFATEVGGTSYDLSTWVVDGASHPAAIAIGGSPFAVTAGTSVAPTLGWSGVTARGAYRGVVTYHATGAPSTADASSIVALTKTADGPGTGSGDETGTGSGDGTGSGSGDKTGTGTTGSGGGTGTTGGTTGGGTDTGGTTTGTGPGTSSAPPDTDPRKIPKAAAKTPRLRLAAAHLRYTRRHRILRVRLRLTRRARVTIVLRRNGRVVAHVRPRRVRRGTRTVRFRLNRALARHRTYRVTVAATALAPRQRARVRGRFHLR